MTGPGAPPKTTVRDIFDLVGPSLRAAGRTLSADEVKARTTARPTTDLTRAVFDIYVTTGAVNAANFVNLDEDPGVVAGKAMGLRTVLRRLHLTFAVTSDALLRRAGRPDRASIVLYLDSPRVQIAEM